MMNRALHLLNLAGVLALAVLCVAQWRANRALNLEMGAVEKARQEQAARLDEQRRTAEDCAASLEAFREQLVRASAGLREAQALLAVTRGENEELARERDQLRDGVDAWEESVRARDQEIRDLAAAQTETAAKFNALVEKHNRLVRELDERNRQLSELAQKTSHPGANR